jgi:DNA invertase Pin-like site-specific DNA recombinase
MRLVAYVRVSSSTQLEGLGLDVQEQAVRTWAKANGHRIVELCSDPATSGTVPFVDRPGVQCVLDAIQEGKAEGLVVAKLDRLSRLFTDQEAALAKVWEYGGSVFTVETGEVLADDPEDPMRTAIRQIIGVIHQLDRAQIAKRLRDGRRLKAERGGHAYGRPPFGWKAQGKELVEDPAEQVVLARIAELRQGGASLRQIGAQLEVDGHRPRGGARWHPNVLSRIVDRMEVE